MNDKTSKSVPGMAELQASPCPQARPAGLVRGALSTQQKNALRKIFNRQLFSPEDVAQLGYRRLQQAEGIGRKGLQAISDWLLQYGLELTPPEQPPSPRRGGAKKAVRSVAQAMRLLRALGYEVVERGRDGKRDF